MKKNNDKLPIVLRGYVESDLVEISELFYNTVHGVCNKDYTKEQLKVWATGKIDKEAWNQSLKKHETMVALINHKIVGFGDLDGAYLDRLYVHKDYQNRGIATAIVNKLEQLASDHKETSITVHASITARPFFEKQGYTLVKEQQVERQGILLTNYVMEKNLLHVIKA